jgi:hypothetical protein
MNRSSDRNVSLFNAFLAPSGMFTCDSSPIRLPARHIEAQNYSAASKPTSTIVFNPYQPAIGQKIEDKAPLEKQNIFLDKYERAGKHKLFDRSDFEDYALTLVAELIPDLIHHKHDVIIFPLRGCRQPGIVTKVVAGIPDDQIVVFNYTYATSATQQDNIRSQLTMAHPNKSATQQRKKRPRIRWGSSAMCFSFR